MSNDVLKAPDLRTASAEEVNSLMNEGAQAALEGHRSSGQSVVVWRDGQVVEIPAERIELAHDPAEITARS